MRPLATSLCVASALLLCAYPAFGQSPVLVKYCRDLATTYRQAVSSGKPPVPGVGQAIVDCPTNPNDAIPPLEAALKQMQVDLPPK